jgi:hypothetical protein
MDLFIPSAPKTVTQEDIAEQTLKFFISGNVTFNQADNPEFDKLLKMAQRMKADVHAPSRWVIRDRLRKYHI